MHVAIALLRLGYRVGTIDLDARQGTMTRYMRNRFRFIERTRVHTPMPNHMAIMRSSAETMSQQAEDEHSFLLMALDEMGPITDFIVVDTPGADTNLNRLAHGYADTLLTPMNDSFVDLDLLADIDPDSHAILGPSVYTRMVLEQRLMKEKRTGRGIDWLVMRNRLMHLDARNKREISEILDKASGEFGFKTAPGFGERVIFKELFLKGLTLMDIKDDPDVPLTLSQLTARQEVRQLIAAIGPERIKGYRRPPSEKRN